MTKNIRNFAIVAHVDHGKSTLADRLLEMTGTIAKSDMTEQVLDSNPIEKERGITIKLAPVRMKWKEYILNLIDTPGHVDFSYEVSRSLAACEGVILVVDATQGVQAQTLAYMQQVVKRNLKVIPVINKIDLPIANIKEAKEQMKMAFGFKDEEFVEISGKTGKNVDLLLTKIINRIPPPGENDNRPLRMLVFSSYFDHHRGVICFVKVVDGSYIYTPLSKLKFMASKNIITPVEVGYFSPKIKRADQLLTGEVGYVATGLKDIHHAKVGDTLTDLESKNIHPLPGYKEPKPMVFMGLFPVESDKFAEFREAVEKLNLQDGAFSFRPLNSPALGHG
ncbi:GTP-binding protein, partial [Candidatus Gottesmanbacteria bacterium]|nr:GTP-binding protein [Candidatus Gottesmanbacteria bacterium]